MDCNIIKDLIPLYIDGCCSEESAKLVEEHMDSCKECKGLCEDMRGHSEIAPPPAVPAKLRRINERKAAVLQSVLLFVSFGIITVGVALEASTPSGLSNGWWALWLVIPATGFMLSLANWYFVRLYKSINSFSICSALATLGITVCAYIWAGFHYELVDMLRSNFFQAIRIIFTFNYGGFILTAILCMLSACFSYKYAELLGKE